MSTINNTYINALLADAAYAERLFDGMTSGQLLNALSPTMTPTLATFISDNFEVVAHKENGDYVESGFDATVWRGRSGTTYAGQVYVSMQGTLGLQDFLSDANLTQAGGLAQSQLIDMVNWWSQITTPSTGMAQQIQLRIVPRPGPTGVMSFIQSATSVAGTGLLTDVTNVQVNGHSLGGHLSAAFARLIERGQARIFLDCLGDIELGPLSLLGRSSRGIKCQNSSTGAAFRQKTAEKARRCLSFQHLSNGANASFRAAA